MAIGGGGAAGVQAAGEFPVCLCFSKSRLVRGSLYVSKNLVAQV